jgi:hypothetical protein
MSTTADVGTNPFLGDWRGPILPLISADAGSDDLEARLASAHLPGLADSVARQRFVRHFERSARHIEHMRRIGREPGADVRTPPFSVGWSPLPAIVQFPRAGDLDEATWLSYLTTFFGPDERRGRELWYATRALYGGFGEARLGWRDVASDPEFLPRLSHRHAFAYARLPRGNHRARTSRASTSTTGAASSPV